MVSLTNIKSWKLTSLKQRIFTIIGLGTKGDVRTPNECAPYGYDGGPVKNIVAVHANTISIGGSVVVGYINVSQLAKYGEVRIYATNDSGAEVSRIWQHDNGDIELGGTGAAGSNVNHATQWEGLNTAVQNSIVNFINTQLPLIATGIAAGGGSYTPGTMAVDISAAKLTKIKTE